MLARDESNLCLLSHNNTPTNDLPDRSSVKSSSVPPYASYFHHETVTIMTVAPLVWMNGFPGTGKLTVAKAMAALHGSTILLDNHKLIDPVESKISRGHPDYNKARQRQRELAFDEHVYNRDKISELIIFTGVYTYG